MGIRPPITTARNSPHTNPGHPSNGRNETDCFHRGVMRMESLSVIEGHSPFFFVSINPKSRRGFKT